jgi:hypothetical protein
MLCHHLGVSDNVQNDRPRKNIVPLGRASDRVPSPAMANSKFLAKSVAIMVGSHTTIDFLLSKGDLGFFFLYISLLCDQPSFLLE